MLSDVNLNASLAIANQCDYIYTTPNLLNILKFKKQGSATKIYTIDFSEFKKNKFIETDHMFFVLATFGEMQTFLFLDDTQLVIFEAAKMITMPHVFNINISLTNPQQLNTNKNIQQIYAFAKSVGALVSLNDSHGNLLDGKIGPIDHQSLTINISKRS